MNINNHIILQAATVVTLFTMPVTSYAANNLCGLAEKVVFNCQLKKSKKLISVCGSQTLTRDSGYIQYRFGTKNKLELSYPKTKVNTQSQFYWDYKNFYQGGIKELTFENRGYIYIIDLYYVSEEMNEIPGGAEGGGLTVQKKGSTKYTSLKCSAFPEGEFYLQNIVRDASELVNNK
jgi:hypothetical protein